MAGELDLKFMWHNAENLFLLSDHQLTPDHLKLDEIQWQKLSTSIFDNKPLNKLRRLAGIIQDESPDIIMLCEIGGFESLRNFATLFLGNTYSPALVEGNSDRNIDIGFLIKKNLPFYFDVISNKTRLLDFLYPHERENLEIPNVGKDGKVMSHRFSRDVAELHLFQKDRDKPFLVALATHLKSRLDPDGIDPSGFQRRQAELKTLLDIYQETEDKLASKIPVVVAGDFNGNAGSKQTDLEFQNLYAQTKLRDIAELGGLPAEKSHTYYQVNRPGKTEGKQLDYCFLSPLAQKFLEPKSVTFYRYKDHLGQELGPPNTIDAKLNLPSDHYPLFFTLKSIPST